MSGGPQVSVVMGVFNAAETLSSAIESILSQEGVPLEFIAVDDGSTDASGKILDDWAGRDARLRVLRQAHAGLTRALAEGCSMARAPWIARQDADDISLPGRLKAQWERARKSDAPVLVACGAVWRSPEGYDLFEARPPADETQMRRDILEGGKTPCAHGALLFRADAYRAVGGYRTAFYFAQDLDLVGRLAERGPLASLPDLLYVFRVSPRSISGRHRARQEAFRALIRQARAARAAGRGETAILRKAEALSAEIRRSRADGAGDDFEGCYFIGGCLRARHPGMARSYFARALRARPWSLRAALRWAQTAAAERRGRGGSS